VPLDLGVGAAERHKDRRREQLAGGHVHGAAGVLGPEAVRRQVSLDVRAAGSGPGVHRVDPFVADDLSGQPDECGHVLLQRETLDDLDQVGIGRGEIADSRHRGHGRTSTFNASRDSIRR